MLQVHERLFIADEGSCRLGSAQLAVVHACKSPCHQRVLRYKGSLPPNHPNYLVLRHSYDLYLNIIDPPVPLFRIETFLSFLTFAAEHYDRGASLLIHCNQGESRAPTLALLFLSKHLRTIPDDSFGAAQAAFADLCPGYRPGKGIQQFLQENWGSILTESGVHPGAAPDGPLRVDAPRPQVSAGPEARTWVRRNGARPKPE
ncbi:MAG: hypothetical protein AB1898_30445 [Acidobacteriota bacterium]